MEIYAAFVTVMCRLWGEVLEHVSVTNTRNGPVWKKKKWKVPYIFASSWHKMHLILGCP
jgi:hypothetical protein